MNSQFIRSIFIDWDKISPYSYLRRIESIASLETLEFPSPVTFFVGENGSGKSTMLEAIAIASGFNPEGGTRNFNFSTRATHSELGEYLTPARKRYPRDGFFLRAESFYNVATNIDLMDEEPGLGGRLIDSYGGVSLHQQSHGESFLALVQNRFGGEGLYLLDEPIGGVDPAARDYVLSTIIKGYRPASTIILSTHLVRDVESVLDDFILLRYGTMLLHAPVGYVVQEKGMTLDAYFREEFRC